jgi:DNA-binding response OmpR family regulator
MSTRVYVVEDEPELLRLLATYLERDGRMVTTFDNGLDAERTILADPPDLIVLDLLLPGRDGLSVLRNLRAQGVSVPVILLTALGQERERLEGFRAGADDYVVKPFSPAELMLRVDAILRRAHAGEAPGVVLHVGPITLDPRSHLVEVSGRALSLTPTEFRLLSALMSRPGWTFERQQLLDIVAGPDFLGYDRNIDVHIANLRKKLGVTPSPIHTVYGVGYRMMAADTL